MEAHVVMTAHEVNFDGIVGPTHNYAGLSFGNLASQKHASTVSHPKQAALQGLAKMKYLADLGLKQAVLPPQERPDLSTLRRAGFTGSDADILAKASKDDPRLLAAVYSASSMWAANAATVSPSADSADGRVHITPANLVTHFHRSIEPPFTAAVLKAIFPDESVFAHHPPLPAASYFSDEGAANHMRLCEHRGSRGVEVFVYGRSSSDTQPSLSCFPARQTLEASRAISRLHGLDPAGTTFIQQNPEAVDAGAFHNDVVAVANCNVLLFHSRAYSNSAAEIEDLQTKHAARSASPLYLIEISEQQVPLSDAVATYLFNSQIVTLRNGSMALIAPIECRDHPGVRSTIDWIVAGDNPIQSVHYLDVRQSMNNGGGPACLRLRVVLTEHELACVHAGVFLTDALYAKLVAWVERHYRDELRPQDLSDARILQESRRALDELSSILELSGIYLFQK